MAKNTPEGQVKARLLKLLQSFGDDCFYYMPVQNGMGLSGIPDIIAIIRGVPLAFECKATPKQNPTTLQAMQLEKIHKSGGTAWVIDNENIAFAEEVLSKADWSVKLEKDELEDMMTDKNFAPFYRWKFKLQAMEFV